MSQSGQNIQIRFREKLQQNYDDFQKQWRQLSKEELIEKAEQIAAVQRMVKKLPRQTSDDEAEYLLKFKCPLEVVSDFWIDLYGISPAYDENIDYLLWKITDTEAAEEDYDMEDCTEKEEDGYDQTL
jgi:hypothetical protein